ncbi:MAG: group II intron reverse transcriptase/maturase [Blastocatellia bacterium]
MFISIGASLHKLVNWHEIDWKRVNQNVRRLQARIVKALTERNKRKVRALQFILTRSFSGRAMAVRRVTENQGSNTAGVDKEIWNTPEKKTQAVAQLQHKGYQPKPLKRVYIPKIDGKLRPLSIPTIKDRAMQALHLMALDPIAETQADRNSYGFRRERATADAIEQCFNVLSQKGSSNYILEGDIKSCFDKISHQWILSNIPMDRSILGKWLKVGYFHKGVYESITEGTPQGGIISPTIMNIVLDGLEKELLKKFSPNNRAKLNNKVHFVRYADDFIVTGSSKELLEQKVKPIITAFLQERGLELSEEKTRIAEISKGFNFLGKNVRKYKGKLLIKPSVINIKVVVEKIGKIIKSGLHNRQEVIIMKLNPVIKGWANYHRHKVSKAAFNKVDNQIFLKLWKWAKRRHPNKSSKWIKKKYFKKTENSNWMFQETIEEKGKIRTYRLFKASNVAIKRHTKIKQEANPYNPEWEEYFEERIGFKMVDNLKGKKVLLKLWFSQEGNCPTCCQKITKETGWNIHHIVSKVNGGKNVLTNLVLLHPTCHKQVHNQSLQVLKPRLVKKALLDA